MKNKQLYLFWGFLALLCGGLGFIPETGPFGTVLLTTLALCFFLPGAVLLYRGVRKGDRKTVLRIRKLSLLSLGLTLVLTVLNLVSVLGPQWLGDLVYVLLGLVSVPMLCGRFWWLSLFLWGSFLTASLLYAPQKGK